MSRRAKRSAASAHATDEAAPRDAPSKAIKQEIVDAAAPPLAPAAPPPAPGNESEARASVPCATCGQSAKRRCASCALILCLAHAHAHEDERADHCCLPLQLAEASPAPPPRPAVRCVTHDRSLDLYCDTCEALLCTRCVERHKGHALNAAESVAARRQPALRELAAEAKAKAPALLARRAEAAAALAQVTAVAEQLDAAAATLRRAVDERHAALKRELAAFRTAEERWLADEVARAEAAAEALQQAAAATEAAAGDADPRVALRLGLELQKLLGGMGSELKQPMALGRATLAGDQAAEAAISSVLSLRLTSAVLVRSAAQAATLAALPEAVLRDSEQLLAQVRNAGVGALTLQSLFDWSVEEARRGNPAAHCLVGLCYLYGKGVEANAREAVAHFREGGKLRDANALFHLGQCYRHGEGVSRHCRAQALDHFCSAADLGHVRAQNLVGVCYCEGVGMQGRNFAAALPWFERAAAKGDEDAMVNLAQLYERGMGVAADADRAVSLLWRAAQRGHTHAQQYLAGCCEAGRLGLPVDLALARKLRARAASLGHAEARGAVARLDTEDLSSASDSSF